MPRPAAAQPRLAWAAGALGLTAGLNQVVLLRELLVLAGGNELSLALSLAGWLCLSALGSLLASRLPLAPVSPLPALLVAGVGGLLGLVLARLAPVILGFDPGEAAGLGRALLSCLLALAPAGLAAGAAFPLLLAVVPSTESAPSGVLARVYGLEALGAALAGALFATLLVPACSPLMILLLAALLAAGVAVAVSPLPGRWLALAWALLLASGLVQAGTWDRVLRQAQWPGRAMVALAETPYAQLMATRQAGQTDFHASGLWFLSWPESQRRERLGLLPLLALPQARQALFIGGAAQGAAMQMASSSQVRVTAVEPDPWLLDFVSAHATPGAGPDNLQVVHGDGRLFLQRAKGRFDLVVLDLPPPATVQLNRFYSQEGLAALQRALTPQGVAVLALAGPGEGLGRLQARQMGSLLAAARASFAQVLPFWGPELLLFCAKQEGTLSEDPALWRERLAQRDWPQVHAVRDDLLDQGLDPWRRRQFLETLELTGPHRPNRDLHPLALLHDPHLWGVQLGGRSALAEALAGLRAWHLGLPLLALGALLAWRARRGKATVGRARLSLGWGLLVAGCTSTAWSLLLTMAWQSAFGSLYLGLALLLGSFMLGMGGAALWAGPRLEALARPSAWLGLGHWTLALGCLATLGVAHWLSLLGAPGKGYQVLVLALAALDGALTGAYFALAGRAGRLLATGPARLARLGGGLYGLDLAGGVLGAFWPLLLVPSLGFGACLGLLTLLNLTALAAFQKTKGT
ncbi:MAG: hypothetical protein HY910_14245 [Desulfarculus sp.]|nr:hypothetical protein [Desulfarculus sp.]